MFASSNIFISVIENVKTTKLTLCTILRKKVMTLPTENSKDVVATLMCCHLVLDYYLY